VPFLRFAFPLNLDGATGRYEIPFGTIDRSLNAGQEVPAQQWAQVSGICAGKKAGCLLVTDSKYGHSLEGSTLRLSLIRAAYDPDPLPEIGQHEVHVALLPFGGEFPVAKAMQVGRTFNHALRVVGTDIHPGRLPLAAALVTVAPASVVLNCLKKAEADDSLVLILSEPTGKDTTAQVSFNRDILGQVTRAVEVDLLERPVAKSSAKVQGDSKVRLRLPARGIASVLVKLKR
jgi:alpha-mannosidase